MSDLKFNKTLLITNALVPLVMLIYDSFRGNLGANPIEFFLRATGFLALIFLFLTLVVTPLRRIFGWNSLIRFRRLLGLFAFFYAFLHLATYSIFDKSFNFGAIVTDIWQRPFIAVGMLAFILLIPLAATSTDSMIKRLGGQNWVRLHRLTYVIAILGVIHLWLIVKSDLKYPVLFALILTVLFGFRVFNVCQKSMRKKIPESAGEDRLLL